MWLSARSSFYLLLVICVTVLLAPILLRQNYGEASFIGSESYGTLRIAKHINENGKLPKEDSLSYGGRPYVEEYGWPILLSISPQLLAKWLPFIFGVFSFILFYLIISKYDKNLRGMTSLFLILTPAFIYTFSTPLKYGISIFLALLGIYLKIKNKNMASNITLGLVGFFSILTLLIIILLHFLYSKKTKEYNNLSIIALFFFISFLLQFYKLIFLGLPETFFGFEEKSLIKLMNLTFSDFGGIAGFSLLTFVTALLGIYSIWKEKYKFILYFVLLFILICASLYFNFVIYYLAFIIALLAACGYRSLLEREWRSEAFRHLTLLVIICGIIFSSIVFVKGMTNLEPSKGFAEAFAFLKGQEQNTMVFSHYSRGDYIAYTGRVNFIDENPFYARNVELRLLDSDRLLHAKNINTATSIINKYNIKYIWLDKKLIEELWGRNELELLFLLRYSPSNFKKIFDNGDVEIYEYIRILGGNYTNV